jgi:dTDP-4-amino-4,6-dideoxygalactose transaminase
MFIINPDPYSTPVYRIGPFRTSDIANNVKLPYSCTIDDYFTERFGGKYFTYTQNGREAIYMALTHYSLERNDIVTVITTSNNFYVSSCVTSTIEKFCKWNREICPETKVIIVVHEFGYISPEIEKIASLGIPIIEDLAPSFFSNDRNNKAGMYGDFAIYSFPKIFTIQIGGLLLNNNDLPTDKSAIDEETVAYIKKVTSHYIKQKEELLNKRASIYTYGIERFAELGFTERFARNDLMIPSAMLLKSNGIIRDLPALKTWLWQHGIHSSVFYGEDAFFLPTHQNLDEPDVDYFVYVVNQFIERQK